MEDLSQKKSCPVCQKLVHKNYLKRHIAAIHPDHQPKSPALISEEELMVTADGWVCIMNDDPVEFHKPPPVKDPKPSRKLRQQPEEKVQKKLEKKLNGKHQTTPVGIIDILTDTELIEIKAWSNWKSALGQVFAYGHYYPNHMKRIHFFGCPPSENLQQAIFAICASLRIRVTIEPHHLETSDSTRN